MIHKTVARSFFSFPSLLVHTARNKMQTESRATPTLHRIEGSIINRTILDSVAKSYKLKILILKNSDHSQCTLEFRILVKILHSIFGNDTDYVIFSGVLFCCMPSSNCFARLAEAQVSTILHNAIK